ncbi:MAG: YbaY family lipoprotein [Hydrogenophilaceae bacterium]|nr:YbaY family lipoprotein [Hydrogenophilaceae bacterium]
MASISRRPLAALIAILAAAALAACAGAPQSAATATVTGAVTYEGRSALPRPGAIIVTLEDASRADARVIVARQEILLTGAAAPPFPFRLVYEPGRINPRGRYVVRAEVRDAGGELRFTTVEDYLVITQGAPRVLDIAVHGLNEPPAPTPEAEAPADDALATGGGHSDRALRARGVLFRAVGNEPGWLLDLFADRFELSYDYGNRTLAAALPAPSAQAEGVTRYDVSAEGQALAILIRRTPCQDVMSGETFPASVTVTIGAQLLQGCGRSP